MGLSDILGSLAPTPHGWHRHLAFSQLIVKFFIYYIIRLNPNDSKTRKGEQSFRQDTRGCEWVCRVWRPTHSQQHTYISSSYRSNRLGLSHWDPYTVHRGSCLELYYCNMVEWFWWDSSLIFDANVVSFSALTLLVWSTGLLKSSPK